MKTSTATHTPGPWSTDGHYVVPNANFHKAQPGTLFVALCGISSSYRPEAEVQANARLVAAAPELLAALRDLLEVCEGEGWSNGDPVLVNARAAITKATTL